MFLIDDILMSPVKFTLWLAEKIKEQADEETHDLGKIKQTLAELQEKYDSGQLAEKEFHRQEDAWLERFEAAQEYHKDKAKASAEASDSQNRKAKASGAASDSRSHKTRASGRA